MIWRERTLAAFCALCVGSAAFGEPIRSLYLDVPDSPAAALSFDYDDQNSDGTLAVEIDSFSLLIERSMNGGTVNEFIQDASITLTATGLTDISQAPLAAGSFASVEFALRDGNDDLLLSGANLIDANVIYAETAIADVMLLVGGFLPITGGSLAADFDTAATLVGLAYNIDPGTDSLNSLDTDHSGGIQLSINPVPEPGAALMMIAMIGLVGGIASRRSR